jgi:nucleoside-diphosphate-sugar epimerase
MSADSRRDLSALNVGDMHAVVTGIGGFLGRALTRQLIEAGATVVGLDQYSSSPSLPAAVAYRRADLRDVHQVQRALALDLPQDLSRVVVFHLAAQSHVGRCQAEPLAAFAANVTSTANVLETSRLLEVKRIVFPSTALVYARPSRRPIEETHPLAPESVYAATKRASEILLGTYASNFGLSCRIARLGNVFGPYSPADSVVAIILDQVRKGGPIHVKTLSPVRDFIYRDDAVRGLITLARRSAEPGCEIFNLSSGVATSIRELALAACRAARLETQLSQTEFRSADIDDEIVLSIRRLSEYGPWRPVWSLEAGLRQTLAEQELLTQNV